MREGAGEREKTSSLQEPRYHVTSSLGSVRDYDTFQR